jgi:dGTPase
MESIRHTLEEIEKERLCEQAFPSAKSRRKCDEKPCDFRTAFQKDRDKILHSKAFRRLKHKTQVFLAPLGDHYRTRLTHTLEVMQIGRTIARALRLNEDLVEAGALGHDLGHTPFGHSGEEVLNQIHPSGFHHVFQSVRIVDHLENNGEGLNLTAEVREAIAKHSKGKGPILTDDPKCMAKTLEGQIVRLADIIAYINHDLDDAVRAGLLAAGDIPKDIRKIFGETSSQRIETMIRDTVQTTAQADLDKIRMSEDALEALTALRAFMFENVYESRKTQEELTKAKKMMETLYHYYKERPDQLLSAMNLKEFREPVLRHLVDFLSGMTDFYAIRKFEELFLPNRWRDF